jgi:hypothetical protein
MSTRLVLFGLWCASYFLCVIMLLSFLFLQFAEPPNMLPYMGDISAIYVPFLTPMLAFWFPQSTNTRIKPAVTQSNRKQGVDNTQEEAKERDAYRIAVGLSLVYNLVVLVLFISIYFRDGEGTIEQTIKLIRYWGAGFGVFVGLAIGYLFRTSGSAERKYSIPKRAKSPVPTEGT